MGMVFRSPIFWVGFVVVLILAVLVDFSLGIVLTTHAIASGRWDSYILGLGFLAIVLDILSKRWDTKHRKLIKDMSRLIFFVAFVWVWRDYGFLDSLYFSTILILLTKLLRLIIWKISKRKVLREI